MGLGLTLFGLYLLFYFLFVICVFLNLFSKHILLFENNSFNAQIRGSGENKSNFSQWL